ncbi:serine hydrolase domain-containing protein [Maritalea sp. S77]|uniref:serine hydrolase domain-containing protein n=1 Tax=Maritalea sp. S77 TaxID=3415125 RepID=UPI003C7D8B7F
MSAHAQDQNTNANLQKMMDDRLPQILQDAGQIGNGGVVMQNGNIVAESHSGLQRKDTEFSIDANDVWHIGSITKSITATMIGRLADQGKLNLSDSITDLWPEQAENFDPAWRTVTMSQLLHHTSGAKTNFGLKVLANRDFENQAELDSARQDAVLSILQKAPETTPGTNFEYSNVGYTIAGQLAVQRAGKSWEQLVREEVFEPLKLTSAGFGPPQGQNPWGHAKKLMVLTQAMDPTSSNADNSAIMGPAGIVHMSLADLAKYGQAHLAIDAGTSDYISAETAKALHTSPQQINENHPPYAAGWIWMSFSEDGRLSLFHNGSNTMWYAFLVNDPKTNASFAFATNIGNIKRSEFGFGKLTHDMLGALNEQ